MTNNTSEYNSTKYGYINYKFFFLKSCYIYLKCRLGESKLISKRRYRRLTSNSRKLNGLSFQLSKGFRAQMV